MAVKIEGTRDKIARAALSIFSSKGYASATTREIANEAGVNEVTLFRHFGSKDNLLAAVLDRFSIVPVVAEALQHELTGDYARDLKTIAHHVLDVWDQRKELIMFMLRETHQHPEELRILTRIPLKVRDFLTRYFSRLASEGVIKELNHQAVAQSFLGGLFSYFVTKTLFGPAFHPYSRDEYVNTYVDVFVHGTATTSTFSH